MVKNIVPPRLHVLLAAQSNIGLIIRRGPSKQYCTVLWDRKTDHFTLGQWFKGHIYEHRSDLSPNGKYFLYFAMNARRHRQGPLCWTAVSRAPYLRAIALYGEEETWLGGGHFINDKTYRIARGVFSHTLRESHEVVMQKPDPKAAKSNLAEAMAQSKYPIVGDLGLYCQRLERDGWSLVSGQIKNHFVFEKAIGRDWFIKMSINQGASRKQGKPSTWNEYSLVHLPTQTVAQYPDWEWAELDRSRLVWATKGQIWAGLLQKAGLCNEKMLYDFNDMQFEAVKAPYE